MKPNESQNNLKNWFIDWNKSESMSFIQRISRYFVELGRKSIRFKPINKCPKKRKIFDEMAFYIFCTKHKKIAVCDNIERHKELTIGLPYIYLSPDLKNRMTAEDGVSLILSDGDSRLFAKYKEERPFDTNTLEAFAFQLIQTKFGFTRFVCLVGLHSDNPVLQCCRKTSRIIWLNAEYFPKDFTNILGDFLKSTIDFEKLMNDIRMEYGIYSVLCPPFIPSYSIDGESEYDEHNILKSFDVTEKQIEFFFFDFIEHCFPAIYMTFLPFKTYLKEYGFVESEKCLQRMFYGFALHLINPDDIALLEGDLLIGLAFLDNGCPSYECRLEFVFRYYDFDRDGYLSEEEFKEMIRDIDTNQTQEVIERIVLDNTLLNGSPNGMTFEEFYFGVREGWLEGTDRLCRFESQILGKILSDLKNREKSGFKKRLNQYFRRLFND